MELTLDQAQKGQKAIIRRIPDGVVRVQAIRFGIGEGSAILCVEKLPKGPVIIQKGRQEIAIGRKLAASILVETEEKLEPVVIKSA
jgi:Fe2+ transport system protein FeoA